MKNASDSEQEQDASVNLTSDEEELDAGEELDAVENVDEQHGFENNDETTERKSSETKSASKTKNETETGTNSYGKEGGLNLDSADSSTDD